MATDTNTTVQWTCVQLVPNTEGILVGRQRKPRPFREVVHTATSCKDAYAIQARLEAEGIARPGQTTVRANGEQMAPYRPGWDEYQALVAERREARS